MPFTPFHLGPLFVIGFLFFSSLYFPALVLGGTLVDVEPLVSHLRCFSCPSHGFFHSFIGASIVGLLAGAIVFALKKPVDRLMRFFKLEQPSSLKKSLFSGLVGAWSHVLLDAPLYAEMQPFYPLSGNLFLGFYGYLECCAGCAILIALAGILYYHSFWLRK